MVALDKVLQQLLGIFERQGIESANQESRNEYARDELSGMAPRMCEQILSVCGILSDEAFVRFVSLLKDDSLDDKAWGIICDAEKTRNADSESELKCRKANTSVRSRFRWRRRVQ